MQKRAFSHCRHFVVVIIVALSFCFPRAEPTSHVALPKFLRAFSLHQAFHKNRLLVSQRLMKQFEKQGWGLQTLAETTEKTSFLQQTLAMKGREAGGTMAQVTRCLKASQLVFQGCGGKPHLSSLSAESPYSVPKVSCQFVLVQQESSYLERKTGWSPLDRKPKSSFLIPHICLVGF